jgi:hypothetical protein
MHALRAYQKASQALVESAFSRRVGTPSVGGLFYPYSRNPAAKQRYYFNVQNIGLGPDLVGELFETDEAAWKEAVTTAGQILKDLDANCRPGQEWSLEVSDCERNPPFQIYVKATQLN